MASFSVASMIRPRLSELQVFINHHLMNCPKEIILFHDGPLEDLLVEGLNIKKLEDSGVELIEMNDEFWRKLAGERPKEFSERLRYMRRDAIARSTSDWIFFCDEDELIEAHVDVSEALEAIPDNVDSVVLGMVEAVWGPDDNLEESFGGRWARVPFMGSRAERLLFRAVYGQYSKLFRRGLLGHSGSKYFLRRLAHFDSIEAHACTRGDANVSVHAVDVGGKIAEVRMIHFDAISFERWMRKFGHRRADPSINYLVANPRMRQQELAAVAVDRSRAEARNLFRSLYGLNRWQFYVLRIAGLLRPISDPKRVTSRV